MAQMLLASVLRFPMLQSGRCRSVVMTRCDVLVVGGTHGNEINGAWLVDQWREQPDLLESAGLSLALEMVTPKPVRSTVATSTETSTAASRRIV